MAWFNRSPRTTTAPTEVLDPVHADDADFFRALNEPENEPEVVPPPSLPLSPVPHGWQVVPPELVLPTMSTLARRAAVRPLTHIDEDDEPVWRSVILGLPAPWEAVPAVEVVSDHEADSIAEAARA